MKSYYASRDMSVTWLDAFKTCKAFDMDLVELPTKAESDYFLNLLSKKQNPPHFAAHVGASYVGVGLNEFYWMTTRLRINYPLKWGPGEPNNDGGDEQFLTIRKIPIGYKFNDISGTVNNEMICQHISEPDVNPKFPQCNPATLEW